MWLAELLLNPSPDSYAAVVARTKAKVSAQPINIVETEKGVWVSFFAFLKGDLRQREETLELLASREDVTIINRSDDLIVCQTIHPLKAREVFNPHVMHLEPITVHDDGTHSWTLGSWDRDILNGACDFLLNQYGGKLVRMGNSQHNNVCLLRMNTGLTEKQKNALMLAIDRGYYETPRKATLRELSEEMGLSFSTYQSHLRKAERKVMPLALSSLGD